MTTLTAGPASATHSSCYGFVRHALQPGDAADGQQGDVARLDAVAARGQGVAEFVQHHAAEQRQHEADALQRAGHVARLPASW